MLSLAAFWDDPGGWRRVMGPMLLLYMAVHCQCNCCLQVSMEEAERRIKGINEPYKLEILESIAARHPDTPITIYHLGQEGEGEHWWDLCAGPHVNTTKDLNPAAVELESIAGRLRASTPNLKCCIPAQLRDCWVGANTCSGWARSRI